MSRLLILPLVLFMLAACSDKYGGEDEEPVDDRVSFNGFVLEQINEKTADNTDSVDIEDIEFIFNNEDKNAFDSILN